MRVSVRENDPGFINLIFPSDVYVDGVKVDNCFTADEDLGIAYCFAVDADGFFVEDESKDLKEIEVHGIVEVKPRRQDSA